MPHCNMHRFYRVSEGVDCAAVFRVVTSTCRAEEGKHTSQAAPSRRWPAPQHHIVCDFGIAKVEIFDGVVGLMMC